MPAVPLFSFASLYRGTAINFVDLQVALQRVDVSALLVSSRTLRKLIERDRGLRHFGSAARGQPCYEMPAERLAALADDLSIQTPNRPDSSTLWLLVAAPDPEKMAVAKPARVLLEAWRRLYRAKVQSEVRSRTNHEEIQRRREEIGQTEFEEIREVLMADDFLFNPGDDSEVYVTFAGVYLESATFMPALIHHMFPAIEGYDRIERCLAKDVDAVSLLESTKPAGAADPPSHQDRTQESEGFEPDSEPDEESTPDEGAEPFESTGPIRGSARLRLLDMAKQALLKGNAVRAAILREASAQQADPGSSTIKADRRATAAALEQLASRLQAALFFRKSEIKMWTDALNPLIRRASRGFWTPEARLLYDLQKVCIDHERESYQVDLLGWLFSKGRRPLKRPLPHLREVTISKHLRSAWNRLNQVKLLKVDRERLDLLLRPAVRQAEDALRERFRPTIDSTLKTHWVVPRNLPERVAYRKLVEELLDKVVDQGFLSLGELRDAASRSQLKLPDLAGPSDFYRGNALLQTDRALSIALEGVYRRGEIYLRWLQEFSSLAFATPIGRFLSLYIALPFGSAFVLLEGLQHLVNLFVHHFSGQHVELMNRWSLLAIGSLALGAINFLRFRRDFLNLVRAGLRTIRAIVYDIPARLLKNPILHRILKSRIAIELWMIFLKPALFTLPLAILLRFIGVDLRSALLTWSLATLAGSLVINTKLGRKIEDEVLEAFARGSLALVQNWIPGLFHLIMNSFQHFIERIDQVLYAVDEWLRFRDGQSRASLIAKGIVGLGWFAVAYLARIYVNLLIEPQLNPIKHFPVVTVSHKVILPMSVPLVRIISAPLKPLVGYVAANAIAGANVLLLPGVFGFLVWELKSNWRLYEANRSETLDPILVGSHGETITRLLRRGFHSGTLPKAFAKLRRSEWNAMPGVREKAAMKPLNTLHHNEESIRHFIERDFLALLEECRETFLHKVEVGSIYLSTTRIRVELILAMDTEESLWLDLEEQKGTLIGRVSDPGPASRLSESERIVLEDALAGFFRMCGIQQWHDRAEELSPDGLVIKWKAWLDAWASDRIHPSNSHFGRVFNVEPLPQTAPVLTSEPSTGALGRFGLG